MKILTKILILGDIIVCSLLLLINLPTFNKLHKKFINYSVESKNNRYLSYVFFNKEKVDSLVDKKIDVINIDDNDTDKYYVETKDRITYDNEYDEIILSRDPGNEDYKVIKTKIGNKDAYMVAIYDPSKVHILTSKKFASSDHYSGLETVKQMAKRLNASVGINGGGFKQDSRSYSIDTPTGYVIKDNKVVWSKKGKGNLICMTNDNKLTLLKTTGDDAIKNHNVRDALEFGPFLIVDGVTQKIPESAGGYTRSARSVIAQRKDGVILFIVTNVKNGYTDGSTLKEIVDFLEKYDVYNAANLDGGASSQLVVDGKVINKPLNIYSRIVNGGNGRSLVTGWGLINE